MMAAFSQASSESIQVFDVKGRYMFKHYFQQDEIFNRIKQYYNPHQYRFEVPYDELTSVREFLNGYNYELVEVTAIEEFVVAVKKYTNHPNNIFKESIYHWGDDGYNCFLMIDQESVDQAVSEGAVPITSLDLSLNV